MGNACISFAPPLVHKDVLVASVSKSSLARVVWTAEVAPRNASLSFNVKSAASDYTELFVQISGVLCSV